MWHTVHSLPNGLTIYELQVSSHNEKVNSVIGGPHESFEKITEQTGGLYNLAFSRLVQSLENYRNFGPPSLPKSLVMNEEDEQFSKDHKEWEMEEHGHIFEDMEGNLDDIFDETKETSHYSAEKGFDENNVAVEVANLTCSECGKDLDNQRNEVETIYAATDNEDQVEKSGVIKMLFKGTFLENSKMILENLYKFHEFCLEDNDEKELKTSAWSLEDQSSHSEKTFSARESFDDKGSDTEVLKESEVGNDLPNEGEKKTKIKMKPNKNTTKVIMINESRLPNAECEKESESGNSVEDFEKNEVDDACEVMDTTERNFDCLNVVNLVLLIIMIFWFILIPFVMVVGNSLDIYSIRPQESLRLSCPLKDPPLCLMCPQCMYSSHVLVMLDKINEYDAEPMKSKVKKVKGCKNCCCYPHDVLMEHGTNDLNLELSKEFMFPDSLDRAWDEFEDYKAEMFDALQVFQDRLVPVLHAINTDLDQDEFDAEENQVSYFASVNNSDTMSSF